MRRVLSLLPTLAAGALLAPSAFAADCAVAKTVVEKAICADPELKTADDAMTAAYEAVLPKLGADQQGALKANQEAWLKLREDNCVMEEGRKECVLERTTWRANYLGATAETGPGLAAAPLPFVSTRPLSPKTCAADVSLHKFIPGAGAGETAFNAAIDKIATGAETDWGARDPDLPPDLECSYSLDSTITYGSADLVSSSIMFYAFGGGAHGIYGRLPVTVDLKTGKAFNPADRFDKTALTTLATACTASLREEKIKRYGDFDPADRDSMIAQLDEEMKGYVEVIAANVADAGKWLIYADRAEIYFDPYAVGSYAEGEFTCQLPNATLAAAAGSKGWIIP
ncbi:hypothetical protein sos41_05840 [Alphaproteobacteria bacterium SO-S41]|nr:hypothetical protein sos41_05840 [Alphaproteobacteria bacterium SO-S41]